MNGLLMAFLLACPARLAWSFDGARRASVQNDGNQVEISMIEQSSADLKAQDPASPELVLPATATVTDLARLYVASIRDEDKGGILARLAVTRPTSDQDLRLLLDLYAREDRSARLPVESSLSLLTPADQQYSPFFTSLIEDKDPFLRSFGMIGAYRLRAPAALAVIRAVAREHFSQPQPSMLPLEANAWRTHFQALQTLALWEGDKALPLLEKRSKEAPALGAVIATLFWEERLPRIVKWSESDDATNLARASAAWGAPVPLAQLRATAPLLRSIVMNGRKKKETRHQAAIKLGAALDDAGVSDLLKEYEQARDPDGRALLATAIFASRNPLAVPLLERYAKEDPAPASRAAAMLQLREMLPKERYTELLKWAAKHEPDPENRMEAARQLANP